MKNLSVSTKIYLGFGILILFILGAVFISYNNSNRLIKSNELVIHTQEVIILIDDIIKELDDAETGQRGFLLTGEERYLEPYNQAIEDTPKSINKLRELTSDNPIQQENIDKLELMISEKFVELKETIDLKMAGDSDSVLELVLTDKGKNIMDRIRILIQDMTNEEERLLEERSMVPIESQRFTNNLMFILISLSILVGGSIAILISRSISKPINALRHGTEIIGKGNLNHRVGTDNKDEIGQLSRAFDKMTISLKKSKSNIEQKIKNKTADLEELNSVMTGRELKMIELKKKIKELSSSEKD